MKATAIAPANIALIKYWGKKDQRLKLPLNSSISVNLSGLSTKTTVEFSDNYKNDNVIINGKKDEKSVTKIINQLNLIRDIAGIKTYTKVASENNFLTASGLASSASGFAALTLAAVNAIGLKLSEKEITVIARQGSGSACRSIPDGWVEWIKGSTNTNSYAYSIFPKDHWDLTIITVVVNKPQKDLLSTDAQKMALSNPFLKTRINNINEKIQSLKKFISQKKFSEFGELVEKEALELHAITLTSNPSIIYWEPLTIEIMKLIRQLRNEGIESYFTIDAGPHLQIICENKNKEKLIQKINSIKEIKKIIVNKITQGAGLTDKHLF